jgi:hypothetical protein
VAGSLNGRAKRVRYLEEEVVRGSEACPECGLSLSGGYSDKDTFAVVFDDDFEGSESGAEEIPEEDAYCEECGQAIYIVIRFPDNDF